MGPTSKTPSKQEAPRWHQRTQPGLWLEQYLWFCINSQASLLIENRGGTQRKPWTEILKWSATRGRRRSHGFRQMEDKVLTVRRVQPLNLDIYQLENRRYWFQANTEMHRKSSAPALWIRCNRPWVVSEYPEQKGCGGAKLLEVHPHDRIIHCCHRETKRRVIWRLATQEDLEEGSETKDEIASNGWIEQANEVKGC